jgi:ribosomal protein L16 Arg81 hydroxylase
VWEIQYNPNPEFQKGLDVKILKEFTPDTKYELTPGDMIYIPPHIAHHGISQSQSLSLSFGFKSLEDKQIIDRFAMDLINEYDSGDFYKTSFDKACNDTLEIDDKIINDLQTRMIKNLSDKNTFTKMLLKFTSSPKRFSEEIEITREEFDDLFLENNLYKDEFTRFSSKKSENGFLISINERVFKINSEQYTNLKRISDFTTQDEISVNKFSNLSDILYDLCLSGILYFNLDN